MLSSSFESFVTMQMILVLAGLGHYLPLSMRQLDLGIAGYFTIGAFVSAILTRNYHVQFELALAVGTAFAATGALLVDTLATRVRLSGFAYAIFSLGFAESLRILLNNLDFVGGVGGLYGIPPYTTLTSTLVILALVLFGFWWLDRTRLGQIRTAIGDDEFIVPIFGVRLVASKLAIFALGGGIGGLAGGLYAHYVLFIRPDDFGFAFLIALQLPIVFGGIDRFYGALAGLLLLGVVPELARGLEQYRLIFTATATLIVLIIRPAGIITSATIVQLKGRLRGAILRLERSENQPPASEQLEGRGTL